MDRGAAPPVGTAAFRAAAREVAAGVTVASAADRERSHAITATAFCTLSLDPPLVLLALDRAGQLLQLVQRARHVGVSVLAEGQQPIGEWAATRRRPLLPELPGIATFTRVTGAPLIDGSLAWFDCELESEADHGDHTILVGRVVETGTAGRGEPLVYFRGGYHRLGASLARVMGREGRIDPSL